VINERMGKHRATLADRACWVALCLLPLDSALLWGHGLGSFSMSWSRLAMMLGFIALTGRIVLLAATSHGYPIRKPGHSMIGFMVWIAWTAATVLWSHDQSTSIRSIVHLLMLFCTVIMSRYLEHRNIAESVVACIGVVSVASAVIEAITGYRPPAPRMHVFRYELTGFYFNPLHLAASISLCMPYFVSQAFWARSWIKRLMAIVILLLSSYVVFRTGSKGGMLAIACGMIAGIVFGVIPALHAILVLASMSAMFYLALSSGFGGLIPYPMVLKMRQVGLLFTRARWADGAASFSSRREIWRNALKLVSMRPLCGWGLGTSLEMAGTMMRYYEAVSVHNVWLEFAMEGGAISVLLIGWTIFGVFRILKRECRLDGCIHHGPESLWPLMSLVAFVPISLTVSSVMTLWVLWIIIGICIARSEKCRLSPAQRREGRR
jgi:O-antigen ligase